MKRQNRKNVLIYMNPCGNFETLPIIL